MSDFTPIDLRDRAFPETVAQPDFERLLADYKRDLVALYPEVTEVVNSETDPLVIILQIVASEVVRMRGLINDEARKNTLAHGFGSSLDNFGDFWGLARHVLQAADPNARPPVPEVLESDADFRKRIQLAPEGLTSAGSSGSYIYHSLNASSEVKAAWPFRSGPGVVTVAILSNEGDGTASPALLQQVTDYVDGRQPLCADHVFQSAQIIPYEVEARITFLPGYGTQELMEKCRVSVDVHCAQRHNLGVDITRAGLTHALFLDGVQNVELLSPAADVVCTSQQAAIRTDTRLTDGGELV
ncbi:baseplate assembly protein [Halocynthiibacter styelae]|uniref:Baseplate J/gp47 family protein n=1 Tax=Halocynthiibacter styelae TaxID=2761955 RepID=A0A8J7IEX4_9RHOB|nr:baseplate J/gp47 family protein [Paenihalocynthiibacter styelae]MBI1495404.1 baseplate J/gp47 family protein [Paenihalocynthiibacter styelae]